MNTDRAVEVAHMHGERDLARQAAAGSALVADARQVRLDALRMWLLMLPESEISDSARQRGLALVGTSHKPAQPAIP